MNILINERELSLLENLMDHGRESYMSTIHVENSPLNASESWHFNAFSFKLGTLIARCFFSSQALLVYALATRQDQHYENPY
jgi:hypothetical protein